MNKKIMLQYRPLALERRFFASFAQERHPASTERRSASMLRFAKQNKRLPHRGLYCNKIIAYLLFIVLASALLSACSSQSEIQQPEGTGTYADYIDSGKRFAAQLGDVYPQIAQDLFAAGEVREYASVADMLESLRLGRVDAVLISHGYVRQLQDSGMYPDFDYIWVPEDVYVDRAAPVFHTAELRDKYNEWFRGIAEDGTWQEIVDRWIGAPLPEQEDIPQFEFTGENGVLRVCDTGNYPPLIYFDAFGRPAGFDVEMTNRFALHMGMTPEYTMMAYDAIVPYVASGKADMSSCTLTVTAEREEGILFGEPSIITQAVLIVPGSGGAGGSGTAARSHTEFEGKGIAVITGAITYTTVERIGAEPVYYSEASAAAEDVRRGRVDGYLTTLSASRVMASTLGSDVFEVVAVPKELFSAEIGGISHDQAVIDSFDAFLSIVKSDGTLEEMASRWFSDAFDLDTPMPEFHNTGENGVLQIAITADSLPYSFVGAGGQYSGFSIELAQRFAAHEGKTLEFAEMNFSGIIPYIVSQKADISLGSIGITEERKQSVLFTEPYHEEQHGILTLRSTAAPDDSETGSGGFLEPLKTAIQRNLLTDNRWRMIVDGLGVTMIISFLAQILGTVFGCFICFVLTRKNKLIKRLGDIYCGLIHGTPIVVLLMITYYIIFGSSQISNVLVAVAAFTLIMGAGIAGNLKGAIETVDPVEIEAARSIGFTAFGAFVTVTLPQAVRRALPGYTKGFVELVKATAIVGYIAIQDLTRAGDIIRSRTYDAYFPLLFVAVIYLIVTTICVQLFKLIIKKTGGETEPSRPGKKLKIGAVDAERRLWRM